MAYTARPGGREKQRGTKNDRRGGNAEIQGRGARGTRTTQTHTQATSPGWGMRERLKGSLFSGSYRRDVAFFFPPTAGGELAFYTMQCSGGEETETKNQIFREALCVGFEM